MTRTVGQWDEFVDELHTEAERLQERAEWASQELGDSHGWWYTMRAVEASCLREHIVQILHESGFYDDVEQFGQRVIEASEFIEVGFGSEVEGCEGSLIGVPAEDSSEEEGESTRTRRRPDRRPDRPSPLSPIRRGGATAPIATRARTKWTTAAAAASAPTATT